MSETIAVPKKEWDAMWNAYHDVRDEESTWVDYAAELIDVFDEAQK